MSAAQGPKKSAEMELLERLEAKLATIEQGQTDTLVAITRQRGEYLVLRTRIRRCEEDVDKVGKLAGSHEKKINYALGGMAVVGAGAAWLGWAAKQMWSATLGKMFHG